MVHVLDAQVRVLLQGLNASLIGVIPYTAVRLGMYDGLKWAHTRVSPLEVIPPLGQSQHPYSQFP